jgi:hypothetical protein
MREPKHSERWGLVSLFLWTPVALGALGIGFYILFHLIFGKR